MGVFLCFFNVQYYCFVLWCASGILLGLYIICIVHASLTWCYWQCYDPRGHKCFYLCFNNFYLSESMCACDWLQVCLSGCRLPHGDDWLLPWNQKFKGWFHPVPGGSQLLSQTANMCDCVPAMYSFLNKTIYKNTLLLVVFGGWEGGVSLSRWARFSPRPWSQQANLKTFPQIRLRSLSLVQTACSLRSLNVLVCSLHCLVLENLCYFWSGQVFR